MRTTVSENEVNRVAADALRHALSKLPYNAQNELDQTLAEHFMLKQFSSLVRSRLEKMDAAVKDSLPDKSGAHAPIAPVLSQNWRREVSIGAPRQLFDLDTLLDNVAKKYDIPKHELRTMADASKKLGAAPVSITIEYIGDVMKGAD